MARRNSTCLPSGVGTALSGLPSEKAAGLGVQRQVAGQRPLVLRPSAEAGRLAEPAAPADSDKYKSMLALRIDNPFVVASAGRALAHPANDGIGSDFCKEWPIDRAAESCPLDLAGRGGRRRVGRVLPWTGRRGSAREWLKIGLRRPGFSLRWTLTSTCCASERGSPEHALPGARDLSGFTGVLRGAMTPRRCWMCASSPRATSWPMPCIWAGGGWRRGRRRMLIAVRGLGRFLRAENLTELDPAAEVELAAPAGRSPKGAVGSRGRSAARRPRSADPARLP